MKKLVLLFLVACHSTPPPPALGPFPDFKLTDQTGKPVGKSDLAGQVWVADFIFTRCGDICPILTERMAELAKEPAMKGVHFVSFSVDPDHDTPAVLSAYAAEHKASWTFLTGPVDAVAAGAKMALERDPTKPPPQAILHGTHFLLVDRDGKLRSYYDSAEPTEIARLRSDVATLK